MVSLKKQGYIRITNELYTEYYDNIKLIFSRFRVTHIEYRHWDDNMWYLYGICEDFDESSIEAEAYPFYDCVFTGNDTFQFNRV